MTMVSHGFQPHDITLSSTAIALLPQCHDPDPFSHCYLLYCDLSYDIPTTTKSQRRQKSILVLNKAEQREYFV